MASASKQGSKYWNSSERQICCTHFFAIVFSTIPLEVRGKNVPSLEFLQIQHCNLLFSRGPLFLYLTSREAPWVSERASSCFYPREEGNFHREYVQKIMEFWTPLVHKFTKTVLLRYSAMSMSVFRHSPSLSADVLY